MITVALPKGRIAEETLDRFEKIFGERFVFEDRKLILERGEFKFLLVRNQDVPTYVLHQAADIGIVGLDVLEEQESDLIRLLDLGIGRCKVVIGSPMGSEIDYSKPQIKIATKMTNIAKKHFAKQALAVDLIKLYGSIELAPLVGLADAIVDIVETGTTMKQNHLKIDEVIMESSAYMVANRNSFYEKKDKILELQRQFSKLKEVRE
ncbi:ATP phosphoribosyltransferase [Wolinella succinogenes]|uniref:ATP phosphoribosyltransferase n=1 Tax=Wolinella succinogenes (strain ATCC 29543 / DSM 1740 / CCUG 13145 / JCM 31913 / LMG 7466 / NCTC 11488 / FDC 602W) TaxID=273121 RepID=HIS1_WOLSU|nr:ATP phosphoribosyltransferase [Wolinella succinogenes]Q7M9N0.1 RecName: Full=ATP phosphoribosyltransferase; Short=ATP-PRT; Short=ATP-PRTase [Wolinella succinogenes DSM 1740]HCZ18089.1 ATP phosphoribosyltransferase [Helicobacter sp.]NLU33458.1 ATP phosphoribosyltransferase [Wolinella succinogenes]CAE09917.1 ATP PHOSPHORIBOSYLTRANSFERASE [Wolinella succinogenes]VEG82131.1 ATP phosphoribosyltransferase [Wolinella succinogenes]